MIDTITQATDLLKNSSYRFKRSDMPAVEIYIDADREIILKYVLEYFKHHYNITFKSGLFSRTEYKAEQVLWKEVSYDIMDIYLKIAKDENAGSKIYISAAKGDEVFLSPLSFGDEYDKLKEIVYRFANDCTKAYNETMYELTTREIDTLSQDIVSLEKEAESLPYKVAINKAALATMRQETSQLEKRLRRGERSLEIKKKTLEERQEMLQTLKSKLNLSQ